MCNRKNSYFCHSSHTMLRSESIILVQRFYCSALRDEVPNLMLNLLTTTFMFSYYSRGTIYGNGKNVSYTTLNVLKTVSECRQQVLSLGSAMQCFRQQSSSCTSVNIPANTAKLGMSFISTLFSTATQNTDAVVEAKVCCLITV